MGFYKLAGNSATGLIIAMYVFVGNCHLLVAGFGLRSHLIFRSLRESCCVANRQTILSHCEPVQASVVLWAIYYMRFRVVLSVQSRLCFKPHSKTPLSKIIAIDCVQFKESLKHRYAWPGLVSHELTGNFHVPCKLLVLSFNNERFWIALKAINFF